jgi:DNA-binding GntR family transcriptional regulator
MHEHQYAEGRHWHHSLKGTVSFAPPLMLPISHSPRAQAVLFSVAIVMSTQAHAGVQERVAMNSGEVASLATEAYTVVRRRILRGELVMGQPLSRRKLAAELGMSFLPVSEALLRLEFEGLLESRPRAGTRIRIPSREDVKGHYVVREALEVRAAMLFAEKATAEERAEIVKLAARVDEGVVDEDPTAYPRLHHRLHRRIAECTRCSALTAAIEKANALASIWFCAQRDRDRANPSRRHQDLAAVLSTGDAEKAGAAMREHLKVNLANTMERLRPYFRLRKERGQTFVRSERRQQQPQLMA